MSIALRRRRCFVRNHCCSWGYDHCRFGVTFCDSIVDSLTIIRAIRCQRGNFRVDLIKQHRYFGDVTDIVRRQLRGNNPTGLFNALYKCTRRLSLRRNS
jgi:hypothetical protein